MDIHIETSAVKFAKIALFGVILFFLFSYCVYKKENITKDFFMTNYYKKDIHEKIELSEGIKDFYKSGIIYNPDIDLFIEKEYFAKNKFANSDFSEGLQHWATTGIGQNRLKSTKNLAEICKDDYTSSPYCLKITAFEYPCRIFYVKEKNINFISYPWDFRISKVWLGVSPGQVFKVSYNYKNTAPQVSINILERGGSFRVLKKVASKKNCQGWEKEQFFFKVPEDGRAMMIEIQLASLKPGEVMYLDDIDIMPADGENAIES